MTTRSGKVLKVHRSLGEKLTAIKEAKSLRKVDRLKGLPKSRVKRILWRLQPKQIYHYWFSRDGGITALKAVGIGILLFFVFTLAIFAYFRKDLPDIKDISGSNLGGSISYYDRSGQTLLWQDYNQVKRIPVEYKNISGYVKDATVAVEDRDFYKHRGFDIKGIARAAFNDFFRRGSTQGGSTITQQLVKLSQDWSQQRTFTRKVKELILAVELERTYTKEDILQGYLNNAPYGGLDYGVQSAAGDYFHKSAKDLTLAEAAFLATIPKSPAIYSPYSPDFNAKAFNERKNYVLDSMVQTGKLNKAQAEEAKKVDVVAEVQPQQARYAGIKAPYFVLAARDELITRFGSKGTGANNKIGGWKVTTTLDMNLQNKAEEIVQKNIPNIRNYGADEAALVAQDVKTGQMAALVGGTDFNNPEHGQINYAHEAKIPPGSSFKPYDYAALIENNTNVGAGSVLYDTKGPLPGYPCTDKGLPPPKGKGNCLQDYDFLTPGPLTLRYALGGSRNIPAVKAMLSVVPNDKSDERIDSVNKTIDTANDLMGVKDAYSCYSDEVLTKTTQCHAAASIGDGAFLHLDQHVNGLASLARMGQSIPFTYILKVAGAANSDKPFYEWKQPKIGDVGVKQAVRPETAYIINDMASDGNASYLPAGYYKWHNYNGWRSAIKTGTTNNGYDGLMMSWNTQYAVGSWAGYHTRNKTLRGTMELLTTPMTKGLMTYALDSLKTKPVNWTAPAGIQRLPGFVVRNHIHYGDVEPSPNPEIYPSWYKGPSGSTANSTTDKVSNKLATNCTPDLAKQTSGGDSSPNRYSIDIFYGNGSPSGSVSASSAANDDVHLCSDAKPSVTLTVTNNGNNTFTLTATASQGTHPLNDSQYSQFPGTINFMANGQNIKSMTFGDTSSTTQSYTYSPEGSGTASLSAQVIDSVLYDSTSEAQTITFATAPSPPSVTTLTFDSAKVSGPNTKFSWSGGQGPYSVYKTDNPAVPYCSVTGTECQVPKALAPAGTNVTVKDSTGKTATATISA